MAGLLGDEDWGWGVNVLPLTDGTGAGVDTGDRSDGAALGAGEDPGAAPQDAA